MRKIFELDINSQCWEDWAANVPQCPGIYFVYGCFRTAEGSWGSGDLVYIGEASDLNLRIAQHANPAKPEDDLHTGILSIYKRLWYTYAQFTGSESQRKLCEAALIFKHKPVRNTQHKDHLDSSDELEVVLRGETRKLVTHYVLEPDK